MRDGSGPAGPDPSACAELTVPVRVRPGASRVHVGGRHGDALVVRVTAHPVGGAATAQVRDVVAAALGVRRSAVEVVAGATSRDKVLRVTGDVQELRSRLAALLGP